MKSISFFDDRYPVRAFFSEEADWQLFSGWKESQTRSAFLQEYLQTSVKRVIYAYETHSGNVLSISDESTDGKIEMTADNIVPVADGGYDALVTSVPDILLCIWTADCLPLFLYDIRKSVVAIAHCGWRGICNGIVVNTLHVMKKDFGADNRNITAAFGPCICGNCYEVGEDVFSALSGIFSDDELSIITEQRANGCYSLNLRKAVTLQLTQSGIISDNIIDSDICTLESEKFASFRQRGPSETFKQTLSGIVLLTQEGRESIC